MGLADAATGTAQDAAVRRREPVPTALDRRHQDGKGGRRDSQHHHRS